MRKIVTLLAALTISACAAQEKPQLVADPSIIPAFPPPAVSLGRAIIDRPMQAELYCLMATGQPTAPSCPGTGSPDAANNVTWTAPKP